MSPQWVAPSRAFGTIYDMEQEPKFPTTENIPESLGDRIIRLRKEVIALRGKRFIISDELISFVNNLKQKYPDYPKWRAYHNLIQSSVDSEYLSDVVEEDFPGEDSVVKFLESFLHKEGDK